VLAPRFAESRHESFVVGLQKDELAADARLAKISYELGNLIDVVRPVARIETHTNVFKDAVTALQYVIDEQAQEARRDIVDAIKSHVLERVQCHALSGARESADDDEAHSLAVWNQP
jgi:hypothetical protein